MLDGSTAAQTALRLVVAVPTGNAARRGAQNVMSFHERRFLQDESEFGRTHLCGQLVTSSDSHSWPPNPQQAERPAATPRVAAAWALLPRSRDGAATASEQSHRAARPRPSTDQPCCADFWRWEQPGRQLRLSAGRIEAPTGVPRARVEGPVRAKGGDGRA